MMPGRVLGQGQETREGYTGHELDAETGMYYAGARYYMPALARWTAVDPMKELYQGWSTYNYVLGNPLLFVDPTGNCPEEYAGQVWENPDTGVEAYCMPGVESTAERPTEEERFSEDELAVLHDLGLLSRGTGASTSALGAAHAGRAGHYYDIASLRANRARMRCDRAEQRWNPICRFIDRQIADYHQRRAATATARANHLAQRGQRLQGAGNVLRRGGIAGGAVATGVDVYYVYTETGDVGEAAVVAGRGATGIAAGYAVGYLGGAALKTAALPVAVAAGPAILVGAAAIGAGVVAVIIYDRAIRR